MILLFKDLDAILGRGQLVRDWMNEFHCEGCEGSNVGKEFFLIVKILFCIAHGNGLRREVWKGGGGVDCFGRTGNEL